MSTLLLLAEDDPLMSGMYGRAFKLHDFDFKLAKNGEEALSMLRTMDPKPAVAVIDVMMPKKSGFDVLKEMKEDKTLSSIPVIILTNMSGDKDMKRGLELGADLCLVKSQYSSKEVVLMIKELIIKLENKVAGLNDKK